MLTWEARLGRRILTFRHQTNLNVSFVGLAIGQNLSHHFRLRNLNCSRYLTLLSFLAVFSRRIGSHPVGQRPSLA